MVDSLDLLSLSSRGKELRQLPGWLVGSELGEDAEVISEGEVEELAGEMREAWLRHIFCE